MESTRNHIKERFKSSNQLGNFLRIDVDAYGMTPLLAASVTGRNLMRVVIMTMMMVIMMIEVVVWSA